MKTYWIKYRPFLLFLGKFIFTYVLFTFLYQSYLNQYDSTLYEVDGFTQMVSNQCEKLLLLFNENVRSVPNSKEASINIIYNGKAVARILEGCNAMSVIILFVSFVIAFTGKFKNTLLFILSGSFIIHVFNVLRIMLLCILLFHYPEQEHLLHGVIFPLIIYGTVFFLWIVWVNKFSFYAKK